MSTQSRRRENSIDCGGDLGRGERDHWGTSPRCVARRRVVIGVFRQLLRNSALYTLSSVLTRGLSLLLLPVYARVLTRAEYGMYDYLAVIGALAAVTVGLEITQAVMRFVAAPEEATSRSAYLASGFSVVVASYGLLVVLVALFRQPLTDVLLGPGEDTALVILASGQFAAAALVQFWAVANNAQLRAFQSVLVASSSALLGGVLSVLLVTQVSGDVGSLFLGQLLGQGVVVAIVTLMSWRDLAGVSLQVIRRMLAFSLPMVVSSLSLIAMTYLDRFFILHLLGFEELGVYGLSARIATGLSLVMLGFQSALTPLIYGSAEDPALPRRLAILFWSFVGVSAVVVTTVGMLSTEVVTILGGPGYAAGAPVLLVLSAATLIQGVYNFFPGLAIAKKTWVLAAVSLGGILVNTVLNPVLIMRWGIVGSAVATLVSVVLVATATAVLAQRHLPVPLLQRAPAAKRADRDA